MNFAGIAANAGTNVASIEQLIRHGSGSPGLAATIGTTPASITSFVNGQVSADIAAALGATPGAAQELRNLIGRDGAIGIVIGLACGLGANPRPATPSVVREPVDIPPEIAGEPGP